MARKERGYQRRLAEAAGCHTSFLSQILHSHVQLTLDQAACLAKFWDMSDDETEYLLALVSLERSGSDPLRSVLNRKLNALREHHQILANRLRAERTVSSEHRAKYYSAWYYAATHVLLTIPAYRTSEAVARRLGLAPVRAREILEELEEMKLAAREPLGTWSSIESDIHIPASSPLSIANHCNWRLLAAKSMQDDPKEGLHYTAVHSLSRRDLGILRELLLETIQRARDLVGPSPEEELVSLQIDLFSIGS